MKTISARVDREIADEIENLVKKKGADRSAVIRDLLRIGIQEYKLREAKSLVSKKLSQMPCSRKQQLLSYRKLKGAISTVSRGTYYSFKYLSMTSISCFLVKGFSTISSAPASSSSFPFFLA